MSILLPHLIISLEKTGGLFDIDTTLPLLMLQFFILVQLLTVILFNPLQKILEQREEEIETNFKNAQIKLEEGEKSQYKIRRMLEVLSSRHYFRAKKVEKKQQGNFIQTIKFMEKKLRTKYEDIVTNYQKTALEASPLVSTVVKETNKYLRRRPPKRSLSTTSSNLISK